LLPELNVSGNVAAVFNHQALPGIFKYPFKGDDFPHLWGMAVGNHRHDGKKENARLSMGKTGRCR
jgi:hypothetical protein